MRQREKKGSGKYSRAHQNEQDKNDDAGAARRAPLKYSYRRVADKL